MDSVEIVKSGSTTRIELASELAHVSNREEC
jgi:hypothetical protein